MRKKMQIMTAAYSGFCYGVKRAVNMALAATGETVYTLGPIIHNPQMVAYLAEHGIVSTDNLLSLPKGATVIIRSHGVGPLVYQQIAQLELNLLDATCPHVHKAQQAAAQLAKQNYQVVIAGETDHPEVVGIREWSGDKALVLATAAAATKIAHYDKIGLVAQTTFAADIFAEITAVLEKKCEQLQVEQTICTATDLRRRAAMELTRQVDLIIVVGGRNSANTARLAQACQEAGGQVYLVETANELKKEWFINVYKVGITAGASTPDWIIEEVYHKMQEIEQSQSEITSETSAVNAEINELADIVVPELENGSIVKATVISIRDDEVFVDLGYKAEGVITLAELSYPQPAKAADIAAVGQVMDVLILNVDSTVDGNVTVSKLQADRLTAWENLQTALTESQAIDATVTAVVKGGLTVSVFGLRAFVPASQIDRHYVEDLQSFVGQKLQFMPIELEQEKGKIVLSRRQLLVAEQQSLEDEILAKLQPGETISGTVSRLADFGAFVDIGGMDGLVHISDLAWQRVKTAAEVVQVGDKVQVVVLKIELQTRKISLSLKQTLKDPWLAAVEEFKENTVVEGTVVKTATFGAFIELKKGVEGLAHLSELSERRVANAEEVVTVGQKVRVLVLSVDKEKRRIALSISKAQQEKERAEFQDYLSSRPESKGLTLGDKFAHLFAKTN